MDRAKRRTIALAWALAAQLVVPCAHADDYPARPVRIIVGFIPGSSADITARVLGQRMGQILGQQFVVENKPGAGLQSGGRICRARAEGRLHALPRIVRQHHQCGHQSQSFVRPRQGFRADRARDHGRRHPRGSSLDRREQRAGADRARQIEAGRSVLRVDRGRHGPASLRRTVRHARWRQARARALSGQPASSDRSARRAHLDDVLARLRGGLASRNRQAQGARLRRRQTPLHRPQPADHGRSRYARLRYQHLVRPDGAGGNAARDRWTSSRARRARRCSRKTCCRRCTRRGSTRSAEGPRISPRSSRARSSAGARSPRRPV